VKTEKTSSPLGRNGLLEGGGAGGEATCFMSYKKFVEEKKKKTITYY
jgi:hypothetical protein